MPMSLSTSRLFEGHVESIEECDTPSGHWILIHVKGKAKPLALSSGFTGSLPQLGDKINIEVREGKKWVFGEHRTLVITKPPEPYYPLPKIDKNYLDAISQPIREWLHDHPQVSADDVYVDIMKIAGWHRDPRIIGRAFGYLPNTKKSTASDTEKAHAANAISAESPSGSQSK